MKINQLWVIMSSRKELFEKYLGQMRLKKTVLEAVKEINGVLFEGVQDLFDDADGLDISPVAEPVPGEENTVIAPEKRAELSPDELDYKLRIPFQEAFPMARKWARKVNRFDLLWNENNAIDKISFMIPGLDGKNVYFSAERVMYEIIAEGEDGAGKRTYETATNPVMMSDDVHNRILQHYGVDSLESIPFIDIKRLVLGIGLHRTGEEAANIGIPCRVQINPNAIVLSTSIDDRDIRTDVTTTNEAAKKKLEDEYGLPVQSLYRVMLKEWTDASDKYRMDETTGVVYDITKDVNNTLSASTNNIAPLDKPKRKKENTLGQNKKMNEWAKSQDMFRLLFKPSAAMAPGRVFTETIYQVPNNGGIENITSATPYVYMDDDNYESYVKNNPNFDQSQVKRYGVDMLNTIVKTEYEGRSLTSTAASNAYGYDEYGWVENIECALDKNGDYTLQEGVEAKIRQAYGKAVSSNLNNYVAGKNTVMVGGKRDAEGNVVVEGTPCHPLILLGRTPKGYLSAKVVAMFDDSCCKPGESLERIVGKSGLKGGIPTIRGFAIIVDGCNLAKEGEFVIGKCELSKVDISKSTGFVNIGYGSSLVDTTIAVGNNGANEMLPNNRIYGEISKKGLRGVTIIKSKIRSSTIENGYATIDDCNIVNLHMSNAGDKTFNGWNRGLDPVDAANVTFKGDNLISIYGTASYEAGFIKSAASGSKGHKLYEKGEVVTQLVGDVTLDSSAGSVACSGCYLNNVVANGPCSIRTCTLKGTTVGANAEAGGQFARTEISGVNTTPAENIAKCIRIDHGRRRGTVFGKSREDMSAGLIELAGRVYVEGGAHVFGSEISSPQGSDDEVVVRGNMHLEGCSPYTLNETDSAMLSVFLNNDSILKGDCTDAISVADRLQLGQNTFGGSADGETPLVKYAKFKAGDMSVDGLTLFPSKFLIKDFVANNPSPVHMNKSVFLDIDPDGRIIPNERLKTTIWDHTGAFFIGVINQKPDASGKPVNVVRQIVMLKCPNVVLNHDAILRKRKQFVQNMDFDMYAAGKITLREYLKFLEENGYTDCFRYVSEKDFVQIFLINGKDHKTPLNLTADQMKFVENNSQSRVNQFRDDVIDSPNHIGKIDNYDTIMNAYTDIDGRMMIDTERAHYEYSSPVVDDEGGVIQSTCSKQWRDDDDVWHYPTPYKVDCKSDAMYRAGYKYLLDSGTSANRHALDIIARAISGNTEGLKQKSSLAYQLNMLRGNTMKSNDVDESLVDPYNQILAQLNLKSNEKVYFLRGRDARHDGMPYSVLAKCSKVGYVDSSEREFYENAGNTKMRYQQITYSPEKGLGLGKTYIGPVRLRSDTRSPMVHREGLLAREATLNDFLRLGVPDPRKRQM